ncbi:type II toxin-antitoxin system death-on-curing family toxin [Nitriliruptoraceae bacterium ZYF776]|nr:type II toxin-antitoxin system death-on-curing family toxin [Profundirhabdus halotolerans]
MSGPRPGPLDVEYLDLEDLLELTRRLGAGPVRDVGLLDGAASRPRASAFGEEAYADLPTKAAALLHSVVRSHPLVDGNKRLGWLAAVVFLRINDVRIAAEDDAAFELVMAVASGEIDVPAIAGWFASHTVR